MLYYSVVRYRLPLGSRMFSWKCKKNVEVDLNIMHKEPTYSKHYELCGFQLHIPKVFQLTYHMVDDVCRFLSLTVGHFLCCIAAEWTSLVLINI